MSFIQELVLWSIFIISSVYGQEELVTPARTVQLNTSTGVRLYEFDKNPKTYKNYSTVVEAGKSYPLNAIKCFMYGSLSMEKIDMTFEITRHYANQTSLYFKLKNWGNSSKPMTDEEVSLALNDAFQTHLLPYPGLRLISLEVELAKPSGTGFESLVVLNDIFYAQKWSGEFGGTFSDPFRMSDLDGIQPLFNFKILHVTLLTLEVSEMSLPLINTSITKGTLTLQGLKSNNKQGPRLSLPFKTWWSTQYWPSVGTGEKTVSEMQTSFEKDVTTKMFGSNSMSITQNTSYEPKMPDIYLFGTASLEQIDINIEIFDSSARYRTWYHIFQKWGNSTTRPITDEEISMAMASLLLNSQVIIRNISAESIIGIGFESVVTQSGKGLPSNWITYAQKWKGTFGGSFINLIPEQIFGTTILKFSNITKVVVNGKWIRVVATKAILSLDVSEFRTGNAIAIVNRGSLKLEGFTSQSGFFVENPIITMTLIKT
ncbi:hypothetical protein HDV02_002287 [Globomyces sp. JEL0801]|nr:hypothetical protein HDV02_002287 [Globomyces sp. JEL0801]